MHSGLPNRGRQDDVTFILKDDKARSYTWIAFLFIFEFVGCDTIPEYFAK